MMSSARAVKERPETAAAHLATDEDLGCWSNCQVRRITSGACSGVVEFHAKFKPFDIASMLTGEERLFQEFPRLNQIPPQVLMDSSWP